MNWTEIEEIAFYTDGTEQKFSAKFDRESSATHVEGASSGEVSAYTNAARHAVRCAEQLQTDSVA